MGDSFQKEKTSVVNQIYDNGEQFIAGVVDTGQKNSKSPKFVAGVIDTAEKLFTSVNDTADKFFGGVNNTGD